jgi:hypothetical protein
MTLKQVKKQLNALPNIITIKPTSIETTIDANPNHYGKHSREIWLNNPNNRINPFTMIMIGGWAYEVLDIISPTAIVIKML